MKKFTEDELNEIFRKHALWLNAEDGGERANLNGANLDGANLNLASLDGASLDGASLDGASLNRASLDGASLNGASLNGASLDGANLNWASLDGASLDGVSLNGASLNGASLDDKIYQISRIGSSHRMTTYNATKNIIWCGYFKGTLEEFDVEVEETHKDNVLYLAQYRACLVYFKTLRDLK